MYWVVLFFFILACQGKSSPKMTFQGQGYFRCPKFDTNETVLCFSSYAATVEPANSEQSCTYPNLLPNFTQSLVKPNCNLLFMVPIPMIVGSNVSRYFPQFTFQGQSKCIGDFEVELKRDCHVLMSQEEAHFLQMCNAFGVKNSFRNCKCNMFQVQYQGVKQSLCNIFEATKNYRTKPVILKREKVNYKTILKRTCLSFETEKNCDCSDHKIIKANITGDFCQEKNIVNNGIEGLCKFFNISMENCHCGLFNFSEQKNNESVCEYLNPTRKLQHNAAYILPYAIVETVASTIGIFGNLFVVLIAFRFGRGLATCKKLIAHLAFYDMWFAISQLVYAIPKFWTSKFIYGETFCKIIMSCDTLGTSLAVGVIMVISIERFTGIVNPFSRGFSTKSINCILVANLFVGLLAVTPLFGYYRINELEMCKIKWPKQDYAYAYHLTFLVVYLCIPVVLVAILYAIIIATLRDTVIVGNADFIADPRIREKRIQDNKRTMYVLISVVVAFVVFVFPKYIALLLLVRNGEYIYDMSVEEFFGLTYVIYFTYPFHVAINPVIYSIIDSRWRHDARLFFTRAPTRKRSAYSATMTSTVTNRRRSSAATVLGDQTPKRRVTQINNNNNNAKQLIVTTTNGDCSFDLSPIPTPICHTPMGVGFENGVAWKGECQSTGSAFTFVQYE